MQELYDLGIVHTKDVRPFYPRVRDRDNIRVLRDEKSGVIFLESTDHMEIAHYEEMADASYWGGADRKKALERYAEDDNRRFDQFRSRIADKDFIDVGCGTGGLLDRTRPVAKTVAGVEPQRFIRKELERIGYTVYRLPEDAPRTSFDVAGLFHVFEHVTNPLETLRTVRALLRPGGTLILEVPHARDALLKLESFKAFTLWSEHLVLHTRESIATYLEAAGFQDVEITGFQRYPLANHIGWLVDDAPGGQARHSALNAHAAEYTELLKTTDQTDTLIAYARA